MKVLCVAEKPSIAKSVAGILSGGRLTSRNGKHQYCRNFDFSYQLNGQNVNVTMTSVLGHLMSCDFPAEYRKWSKCTPVQCFDLPIIKMVSEDMEKVKQNLITESRHATKLIIWTDCDREGENIGAEIVTVCHETNPRLQILRAKFSVIQPREIHQAMQQLVQLDYQQSHAVDARIELDLRIGAAFTRFQTLFLGNRFQELASKLISYGSCQFPTLGFVVDQYWKVENFVPEDFWKIEMSVARNGITTNFNWRRGGLFHKRNCVILYEQCMEDPTARVVSVQGRETQKWKPLPLTTVELQKCGARILKISSDRMMSIAEKLYQNGYISYPRTETDQFDRAFELRPLIEQQRNDPRWGDYAQGLLNGGFRFPRNGQQNDKAHPPIHPVKECPGNGLQGDDKRVYEFVVRRFLGCCSENAIGYQTTVECCISDETFTTTGLMITSRNYLDVYTYDKWYGNEVPVFQQGETFIPTRLELVAGKTSAPSLLTEADLINLMDKNGIGTDATIQDHIKKIIEREYVFKERKGGGRGGGGGNEEFFPSTLGMALVEGYDGLGFQYSLSKPFLRAKMEADMKQICEGGKSKEEVVREGIDMYRAVFERANENIGRLEAALAKYLGHEADNEAAPQQMEREHPVIKPCLKCLPQQTTHNLPARRMFLRQTQTTGKYYIGCEGYPDCRESIWLPQDCVESVQPSDRTCPQCTNPAIPIPTFMLHFRFVRGKVPPHIPLQYECCIECDEMVRDFFATYRFGGGGGGGGGGGNNMNATQPQRQPQQQQFQQQQQQQPQQFHQPPANNPFQHQPHQHQNFDQDDPNAPNCNCPDRAVIRTVRKPGNNEGRTFWACKKGTAGCRFFQWTEDGPNGGGGYNGGGGGGPGGYGGRGGGGNTFVGGDEYSDDFLNGHAQVDMTSYEALARPSNPSNKPQCYCGLYATLKTSKKEGDNYGREFYMCTKAGRSCNYFQWKDDVDAGKVGPARPGGGGGFGGGGGGGGGMGGDVTCFSCGEPGHFANACPNKGNTGYSGNGGSSSGTSARGGRGRGRGKGRGRGRGAGAATTTTTKRGRGGRKKKGGD